MNLKATYYRSLLLGIHRGNYRGEFSNAKPLYMIALMQAIEDGIINANKIDFSELLNKTMQKVSMVYEPDKKPSPLELPFFHMNRESFYYIKYVCGANPPSFTHTPSAKFLRENVEYACLDDQFWDLLQDKETREEYKQAIINYFINN